VKLIENPLSIFNRAVILKLTIGKPGNRMQLDKNQYEVDADKDSTSAQKKLLKAPEISAAGKGLDQCRAAIRKLSMSSPMGDGTRLLSILAVPKAEELIAGAITTLNTVHKPLIREKYSLRIQEAQRDLNGLFNLADYAPVDEFVEKFYIDQMYISFGAPEALASVRADLLTREQSRRQTQAQQTAEDAPRELATEFKAFTERFIARTGKIAAGDSTKVKGLLDNFLEFLNNVPLRNLLEVEELSTLATKVSGILGGVSPDILRENRRVRDYVENELSGVQTELTTFLNLRPGRSFEVGGSEEAA